MRYEIQFEIKEDDLKFFTGLLANPTVAHKIINRDVRVLPIIENINIEIKIDLEDKKGN